MLLCQGMMPRRSRVRWIGCRTCRCVRRASARGQAFALSAEPAARRGRIELVNTICKKLSGRFLPILSRKLAANFCELLSNLFSCFAFVFCSITVTTGYRALRPSSAPSVSWRFNSFLRQSLQLGCISLSGG